MRFGPPVPRSGIPIWAGAGSGHRCVPACLVEGWRPHFNSPVSSTSLHLAPPSGIWMVKVACDAVMVLNYPIRFAKLVFELRRFANPVGIGEGRMCARMIGMQARTRGGYEYDSLVWSGQVGWLPLPPKRPSAIQERAVRGRCHGLITYRHQLTPAEIQSSLSVAINNHPS